MDIVAKLYVGMLVGILAIFLITLIYSLIGVHEDDLIMRICDKDQMITFYNNKTYDCAPTQLWK